MDALSLALIAVAVLTAAGAWTAVILVRGAVDRRLQTAQAEFRRLSDASAWQGRGVEEVRQEVGALRRTLDELRVRHEERRVREEEAWSTLHRLASVLAGGHRSGRAGENVLRESLAHLPPSMVVSDLRVNGRVVEFGLLLPDGRALPVDSKWPAGRELEALAQATDPGERDRLGRAVERLVVERAREVAGYLDPARTAPVAVAAVPDAAYAVLRRAHADAYRSGVLVVPYSMALPVALFLHAIVSRFGTAGDLEACLGALAASLDAVEATVENKLARASAMLANGTEELRAQVGKARSALARARVGEDAPGALEPGPAGALHPAAGAPVGPGAERAPDQGTGGGLLGEPAGPVPLRAVPR